MPRLLKKKKATAASTISTISTTTPRTRARLPFAELEVEMWLLLFVLVEVALVEVAFDAPDIVDDDPLLLDEDTLDEVATPANRV